MTDKQNKNSKRRSHKTELGYVKMINFQCPNIIIQQYLRLLQNNPNHIQVRVGYCVSNKFQVQIGHTGPHKTLPENTRITGEVIHIHESFKYCVPTTTLNFPRPQNFYHVSSFRSINIVFEFSKPTAADLITYPFGSSIEEQTPVIPASDSSTRSIPTC